MTISFAILLTSVLLEALGRGFPWDGPLVVGHKLASPIDENDASLCIFVTDLWTRRQHVPPTPNSCSVIAEHDKKVAWRTLGELD